MQMRPALSRLQTMAAMLSAKPFATHMKPISVRESHICRRVLASLDCGCVVVVQLPNAGDKPTLTFSTIATNVLVPLSYGSDGYN